MTQAFQSPPPPLVMDDGVIRLTGTRVPLETLVGAFDAGATPEEIVQQYPSLSLASVYAAIAYVLNNRDAVDSYVAARTKAAAALQQDIESVMPSAGIRARLLARRSSPDA